MLTESANQTTAIRIEGEEPPTEFRLFAAGVNDTLNGPYTFDAASAESVMRAAADWGVMTMIDLEHLSVDKSSPNYSPDALGWCRLEVRDGELWAVNVEWNDEGNGAPNEGEVIRACLSPECELQQAKEELANAIQTADELMEVFGYKRVENGSE